MRYMVQPRGVGTAWQFLMATPTVLIGATDPVTGRPFRANIKRGLGTAHLPTARRKRDEVLGAIRAAQRKAEAALAGLDAVSDEKAEGWRAAIAAQDAKGGPDDEAGEVDVRSIAEEIAERAEAQRPRSPEVRAQVRRFRNRTLRKGNRLGDALKDYLAERAEGNRGGYKPLAQTTRNDIDTAVRFLAEHMGSPVDEVMLEDVTADEAHRFRTEFLPERKTKRAPHGLSYKTVGKYVTLLGGIWNWAIERRRIKGPSPWEGQQRLVLRTRKAKGRV